MDTVVELADRKRWARATSKRLKHSRAFRDLLAHLAFRAGCGRVWNYSLADLSEDSNVSKSQVSHISHINPADRAVISNICIRCSRIAEHIGYHEC